MAGPELHENAGAKTQEFDTARNQNWALEKATQSSSHIIPNVRQDDLHALYTAAQNNNHGEFASILRRVAPQANSLELFNQFNKILDTCTNIVKHSHDDAVAALNHDLAKLEHETRELKRLATQLDSLGASGAHLMVMESVRTQIESEGKRTGKSAQEIQQAKEDAARAALDCGFSLSDILTGFGESITAPTSAPGVSFGDMARHAALENSMSLLNQIRDITDRIESEREAKARAKLEAERSALVREYARQMGGGLAMIADQWSRNPTDDYSITIRESERSVMVDLRAAMEAQTIHELDLHSGRLDRVLVVPVQGRRQN
jgi:hypothetical protein